MNGWGDTKKCPDLGSTSCRRCGRSSAVADRLGISHRHRARHYRDIGRSGDGDGFDNIGSGGGSRGRFGRGGGGGGGGIVGRDSDAGSIADRGRVDADGLVPCGRSRGRRRGLGRGSGSGLGSGRNAFRSHFGSRGGLGRGGRLRSRRRRRLGSGSRRRRSFNLLDDNFGRGGWGRS